MAAGNLGGRLPPRFAACWPLDAAGAMTDNFRGVHEQEVDHPGEPHIETLQETLDGLRLEVEELRASRRAARPGRRCRTPQNRARPARRRAAAPGRARGQPAARARLVDADPAAAKALLDEMGRDVAAGAGRDGRARAPDLPAAARGGRARRGAARGGGERRRPGPHRRRRRTRATRPRSRATVYFCCLEVLERAGAGARATVDGAEDEGALAFEIVEDGELRGGTDRLRDRVEALGGRLTIRSEPGRGTRVSARCRSRDDASRSRPGRGSRP